MLDRFAGPYPASISCGGPCATSRFAQMKTENPLDTQTLPRARERLVAERTALINQLRAILLERGISVPQGRMKLGRYLTRLLEGSKAPASVC